MASKTGLRVIALPLTKPVYGLPSFIYYHVQSPPEPPTKKQSWYSKSTEKLSAQWMAWGREPNTSWKHKLYAWGEASMKSVEYEETSLKAINTSFKPGAENPQYDLSKLQPNAYFIYPTIKNGPNNLFDVWKTFCQERESIHRSYFWRWMIGLPITAPLGIAPIIPNVPFYYCAWRSWAHWKAWRGSQYLNQLVAAQYFIPTSEPELGRIYELPIPPPSIPSLSVSASTSHNESESKLSASSSTTNTPYSNDQSPNLAPAPNSMPATIPTTPTTSTHRPPANAASVGRAGADVNATNGPTNTITSDQNTGTNPTNPNLTSNLTPTPTPNSNLNTRSNPDTEIDSSLLLHPELVPHLLSAFKLSSVAGAEILSAIEQAKSRIRKERKKQQKQQQHEQKQQQKDGQEKQS